MPLGEQRIADQALSLLRRETFTAIELEDLRRRVQIGNGGALSDANNVTLMAAQNQFVDSISSDNHSVDSVSSDDHSVSCSLDCASVVQELTVNQS